MPRKSAVIRLDDPDQDTREHRQLVEEALRDLAAERGTVSPAEKRADPGLAAYVVEQAKTAVRAANAVAAGMPEPFYRGEWRSRATGTLKVNFCCLWCGNATTSERLAWLHGMKCRYREAPAPSGSTRLSKGGIT